jgi:hypothetical protein
MKTIAICHLLSILTSIVALAGPIKTQITAQPETITTLVETGTYEEILAFVNAAYSESKAEGDDETTQYAYQLVLGSVSPDKRIRLALDFDLQKNDLLIKYHGALALRGALLKGTSVNQTIREQLLAKLKSELTGLITPGQTEFDFGRSAAEVLILLGDDAGLDVLLTNSRAMRNNKLGDEWSLDTDIAHFQQLKEQYALKGNDPSNKKRDQDAIMAATYELCRIRRTQDKQIKPIAPLARLDKLLGQ